MLSVFNTNIQIAQRNEQNAEKLFNKKCKNDLNLNLNLIPFIVSYIQNLTSFKDEVLTFDFL